MVIFDGIPMSLVIFMPYVTYGISVDSRRASTRIFPIGIRSTNDPDVVWGEQDERSRFGYVGWLYGRIVEFVIATCVPP